MLLYPVYDNIIGGKEYLQNSDLTRDSVDMPTPTPETPAPAVAAVDPQAFLDEKLRNFGTGRDGKPGLGIIGGLEPNNPAR